MCSLATSSKFLPVGSLSRRITISYLLFVGIFGVVTASGKREDNPAHVQMLFQLRVWCLNLIKHIERDDHPDPRLFMSGPETQIKDKVVGNFAANYKHSLVEHVFPLLGNLADSLDVGGKKPEKVSKLKTGGKLLGAGIKMVVGISLLQAGQVFDCFKDVAEVLHGSYEIFEAIHKVDSEVYSFKGMFKKVFKIFQGKKIKMEKRKFKVEPNLKEALKTLKDGLDDMRLEMQGNGNTLTDAQVEAIASFSQNLMERLLEFQTQCEQKYRQAKEDEKYKEHLFYRMVDKKLNELHWTNVISPDVSNIVRMDELEKKLLEQKQQIDNLMWFIGDNIKKSAQNRSDLDKIISDNEVVSLLRDVGCKVDAELLHDIGCEAYLQNL